MIYICDAIMGSGKTQSAITLMNEHPEQKFVYITPKLTETERIAEACPKLKFRKPSNKIEDYDFKKVSHTAALLRSGKNIATTHASFKLYKPEMLEDIRKQGYTLIIDEAVAMLTEVKGAIDDIEMLIGAGYLLPNGDGTYRHSGRKYNGALSYIYNTAKQNNIFLLKDKLSDNPAEEDIASGEKATSHGKAFYWEVPPSALSAFKDVYVLTYMFSGEGMQSYVEKAGIPYQFIGVSRDTDGTYRFSDHMDYYPPYLERLDQMVRIWDHDKMNRIGADRCALSKEWFKKHAEDDVVQLKKNLNTFFKYHFSEQSADKRLWTTFKDNKNELQSAGYSSRFIPCNARATNDYRDRTVLAYCANLFMNPFVRRYLAVDGVMPSNDDYALSIMIQWIWRSAIRDGRPVDVYIPSKRMRTLLQEWIVRTQAEYRAHMEGGVQNA